MVTKTVCTCTCEDCSDGDHERCNGCGCVCVCLCSCEPKGNPGIRSYGPGKYTSVVDSYVHALSMEGWEDDEAGDVSEIGVFYSRLQLGSAALERIEEIAKEERKDKLTEEERDLVRESYGVIISENDQGFVYMDYVDTKEEYDEEWSNVETEVESFYEGQEEED